MPVVVVVNSGSVGHVTIHRRSMVERMTFLSRRTTPVPFDRHPHGNIAYDSNVSLSRPVETTFASASAIVVKRFPRKSWGGRYVLKSGPRLVIDPSGVFHDTRTSAVRLRLVTADGDSFTRAGCRTGWWRYRLAVVGGDREKEKDIRVYKRRRGERRRRPPRVRARDTFGQHGNRRDGR